MIIQYRQNINFNRLKRIPNAISIGNCIFCEIYKTQSGPIDTMPLKLKYAHNYGKNKAHEEEGLAVI